MKPVNHTTPYVGERGNHLCLAQKHTNNTSCTRSMAIARPSCALRLSSRWRQKEISLEYLTEEKFYPLGTTDEYFEAPHEEHPITICGQAVILTNGKLAAVLLSLPQKNREIIFPYFFKNGLTMGEKFENQSMMRQVLK